VPSSIVADDIVMNLVRERKPNTIHASVQKLIKDYDPENSNDQIGSKNIYSTYDEYGNAFAQKITSFDEADSLIDFKYVNNNYGTGIKKAKGIADTSDITTYAERPGVEIGLGEDQMFDGTGRLLAESFDGILHVDAGEGSGCEDVTKSWVVFSSSFSVTLFPSVSLVVASSGLSSSARSSTS